MVNKINNSEQKEWMKGKQSILLSQIEQFSQMVLVGTNQYVLLLIQYIQINLKNKIFQWSRSNKVSWNDYTTLLVHLPCLLLNTWTLCSFWNSTDLVIPYLSTRCPQSFPALATYRFCCTQHTCVLCPQSAYQYKLPINCDWVYIPSVCLWPVSWLLIGLVCCFGLTSGCNM